MTEYSPSFERILKFTVAKSIENREPTLFEIDPKLAEETGWLPSTSRTIQAEWGDIRSVKVFSGIIDEGGSESTIYLKDGSKVEVTLMGHLNVERNGESIERHLLDASGVVYEGNGAYVPMTDAGIEFLVDEIEAI